MTSDPVAYDVALLTMRHGKVNAIDDALLDAYHACLRRADADPDVGAIVLTSGIDGVFCGGMDLKMAGSGDVLALPPRRVRAPVRPRLPSRCRAADRGAVHRVLDAGRPGGPARVRREAQARLVPSHLTLVEKMEPP